MNSTYIVLVLKNRTTSLNNLTGKKKIFQENQIRWQNKILTYIVVKQIKTIQRYFKTIIVYHIRHWIK